MDYKELDVWNAGLDFVVHVYQVTNKFPKEESYGLTSQIRRVVVVSIPSNLAEGAAGKSMTKAGGKTAMMVNARLRRWRS